MFSLSIKSGAILSSGITNDHEQKEWVHKTLSIDNDLPFGKLNHVPMMQARRMSKATSLACENFIDVVNKNDVDAAIFLSEHGELERSHKILENWY